MQRATMMINPAMIYEYRRYIKIEKQVINPYKDSRYDYVKLEDQAHKVEKLRKFLKIFSFNHLLFSVTKKSTYNCDWVKIFDDASLQYDCNHSEFLKSNKVDLSNSQITDQGIGEMTKSEFSINVQYLDLSKNSQNISDLTLRHLADSENLPNLEMILLDDTNVSDVGLKYLFHPFNQQLEIQNQGDLFRQQKKQQAKNVIQASTLMSGFATGFTTRNLESTNMQTQAFEDVPDEDLKIIKFHEKLPNLQILSLFGNESITDQTLKGIAYSSSITQIKYLDLRWTCITDLGLHELFSSPNSQNLQYLDISFHGKRVTSTSITSYCDSNYCKKLTVFLIKNCEITDTALKELRDSQNSLSLQEIDLGLVEDDRKKERTIKLKGTLGLQSFSQKDMISDVGIRQLCVAKYLSNLKILSLQGQNVSGSLIEEFVISNTMKQIEELNIGHNFQIGDQVLDAIGRSEKTVELQKLIVVQTAVTEDGIEQIGQQRKYLEVIHSISHLPKLRQIAKQNKSGARVFVCEQCVRANPTSQCIKCNKNAVLSKEFPAKLCKQCSELYRDVNTNKAKCFGCGTIFHVQYQLYKCYQCSYGSKKHQCIVCDKVVEC